MIEKILKEISRLKKELKGYSASEALDYIEAYINSLPEESGCEVNFTTKNEDLVEEVDNFLKDPVFGKLINRNAGIALARHFAEWQKEQDNVISRQAEAARIKTQQLWYEKGRFDMRKEMMKDAVEGEYWIGEIHLDTPIIQGYDDGDRIKFIPIKTEQ